MKHVSVWNIASIGPRPDGAPGVVLEYITDGANRAACEPHSHALITWGDKVCPACYPATYPSVARHRKDAS